jgi:hypothetical protein
MKKKLGAVLLVVALVLTLGLITAAPVAASPGPGLVGLWHCDEASGTDTAYDSSGNGNDGTLMGDADFAAGYFGNAVSLDGNGDYVGFGSNVGSFDLSDSFTIEAWINPALDNTNDVIYGNAWAEPGYHVRINTLNKVRFILIQTGSIYKGIDSSVLTAGWHHIAAVWDGTSVKIYVDGVDDSQTPIVNGTVANITTTAHTKIGLDTVAAAHYFNGTIDEVRIWDEALTADQIGKYPLTVTDDIGGLSGVSAQSGWYTEGSDVGLTAPAPLIDDYTYYVFLNWDVDGVSQDVGVNSISVHMDAPHTATAHYTKLLSVNKELTTLGDPDAVPLFTKVDFTMTITVHAYAEVTNVYVEDGIGADLVVNSPTDGEDGIAVWKASTKGKMSATKIGWTIGKPTVSEDNTLDIVVYTGTNAKGKQEYTSTGTHYLNSGPKVYFTYDGTTYMLQGPSVMVTVVNGD